MSYLEKPTEMVRKSKSRFKRKQASRISKKPTGKDNHKIIRFIKQAEV